MKIAAETLIPKGVSGTPADTEPKRRYWLGTLPGCPRTNITLRGISFPARTGGDGNGAGAQRGALVELTQAQVMGCLDAMKHRIARGAGQDNGSAHDDRTTGFRVMPGDEPIAKYVYIIPEDRAAQVTGQHSWRSAEPPSVLDMLSRGPNEEDWAAPSVAAATTELDKLRAELKQAEAERDLLKAKLAGPMTVADRAKELSDEKVDELRKYAEQGGMNPPGKATKAELIELITSHELQAGELAK